jgi:hypothetical protein
MREDFDKNSEKPNPYVEPRVRKWIPVYSICWRLTQGIDITLSNLKQVLAAEEAKSLTKGQKPPHDISPSGFLRMAIDIEDRQ